MSFNMGYMGYASVGGVQMPCMNMSGSIRAKPEFFDHVIGLKDIPVGADGSKGTAPGAGGGTVQVQKKIYRYSPYLPTASISGPFLAGLEDILLPLAVSGDPFDVVLEFPAYSMSFSGAVLASFSVDVKAGDVASYTAEMNALFMSKGAPSGPGGETCRKLVTWDACSVTVDGATDIAGLSLTVANPVIPIYTSIAPDLFPTELRIGMQEVSGAVSCYGDSTAPIGAGTVTFSVGGGTSWEVSVAYSPVQAQGASGPVVVGVPFNGAKNGPVWRIP